eukprot:comp23304_c0_seq1/m.38271 comp23304_c0_seq1/g.38271  ORF comp23304_c0_seq1/g.38271 comp23304_c0_seq1/m.38271 type:complete len:638 (-) comp23304_c0_seq1:363-2276(-)
MATQKRESGNLVLDGVPNPPSRIEERTAQYQHARGASFQGFTEEGVLISTRFADTAQIHAVKFPGGARRQLTFFDDAVTTAVPRPSGRGFVYLKDVGGNEFSQIYHFDPRTARHTLLTDGASKNMSPTWSKDGQTLSFVSTKRNNTDWDIYALKINADGSPNGKARLVAKEGGMWQIFDSNTDGSKLLVHRYRSINESYVFILDVTTGTHREIVPVGAKEGEKVSVGCARFSQDGEGVYLTADAGGEFCTLRLHDESGTMVADISGAIPWDVEGLAVSKDGRLYAFATNCDGISRLYLAAPNRAPVPITGVIPDGIIGDLKFDSAGKRLAFSMMSATSPSDVFSLDVEKFCSTWSISDLSLVRWIESEIGGLDTSTFVNPTLFRYKTYDGLEIPCFRYSPPNPKGSTPVVILIHGGPESQSRPMFIPWVQYAVLEMGLSVLVPNVRGSSGYGKSYLLLDNGRLREDSVRDIGGLLDWLDAQPDLNKEKVAVFGGSYGGYMVLASLIHYGSRLRCGVDMVGISNFVTFLENTQPYRRGNRREEYGDESDPSMREFLLTISPTTRAHEIVSALYVGQGLNDPRVPASEAEQIVAAVRANGREVWYCLAKDEGHGFAKKTNRDFWTNSFLYFLEKELGMQ